jgi:hypothetical protein
MASGACASTEASADTPPPSQGNELFLGEEELSDVSLATFYVFDKENTGQPPLDQHLRLARGCGGGGCGCGHGGGCGCGHGGGCGGGGCRMMGGCAGGMHVGCAGGMRVGCAGWHGCRACRCGGFFFRRCFGCGCGGCGWGCGGCGGTCWIWTPTWGWVYSCWGESTPGAEVRAVASEQSAQTVEPVAKADGNIDATRTK